MQFYLPQLFFLVYIFAVERRLKIILILLCPVIICLAQIDFRQLHIVSTLKNAEYACNGCCIAEGNEDITFTLALSARVENLFSEIYLTPAAGLIMAGDTIPAERLRKWDYFAKYKPLIRWYRIFPVKLDTVYQNDPEKIAQWARILYEEIPIPEWNDKWSANLSTLNGYERFFPGTIWLKAEIAYQGRFAATPGIESRFRIASGDYGGLSNTVFHVSKKGLSGNRFLDYMLMFRNLPYIRNPNSWNGHWSEHQAKNWIGGDVLAFTYFAVALAGRPLQKYYGKLPMPPANGFELTDYYGRQAHRENEFYLMNNEKPVYLNQDYFSPGDFIVNRYQVAVLARDLSPINSKEAGEPNRRLDSSDLVLMNCGGALELYPLREALGDTITLIRWKKRW